MTEERGVSAKAPAGAEVPDGVRTGVAADMLRPAAARLGRKMDGQQVRILANRGDLSYVRMSATGWRFISVASIKAYRDELERIADALARRRKGNAQ